MLAICVTTACGLTHAPVVSTLASVPIRRAASPQLGFFDDLFGGDRADEAAKEAAFEAQQEILRRRRNPTKNLEYIEGVEGRRRKESAKFRETLAWQQDKTKDPLAEFKRRRAEDKVNPLGYEDEPKGGIPLPMASFGVGGEFGLGGKYDNGERFDLRLPYVDQGWTEDADEENNEQVDFFANLMSGGRLQREADERWRQKNQKGK